MNEPSQAEARGPASAPAWTIACRDAHLRDVGESDSWSALSAIGAEGVEVLVDLDGKCPLLIAKDALYSIATPDDVKRLGDATGAARKRITAFCLMNKFDEQPDVEIESVVRTAKVAAALGVPAIRIDVWPRKLKDDEDAFLAFAIKVGKRLLDATKDLPVRFGVENHGTTTNKPEFLRKMFDGVGSKRFGLTLDTANFYWFGHPLAKLYAIYAEFAPYVCHTHCKSIRFPESEREKQRPMGWEYGTYCCPIDQGDIDFKRVVANLRKGGYAGDLCIENESLGRFPKGQHRAILAKEAAFLRRVATGA